MKKLCVFCGASMGAKSSYVESARLLGKTLAEQEITLVYGGASVGIMGQIADATMAAGGEVIGVMPKQLVEREVAHNSLNQLIVVENMHERKAKMAELSDGFIALPGGLGTLEELFEVLTWSQLRLHSKPCALLNIEGYYDQLMAFLDNAVAEKFIKPVHRDMILVSDNPIELLGSIQRYSPPNADKLSAIAT